MPDHSNRLKCNGLNGEVEALDPASYGSLNIGPSISILGHGWASMSAVANGAAIAIPSNVTGSVINLNGLVLDGRGTAGTTGISFFGGGTLTIAKCDVRNFATLGIDFESNASNSNSLTVSDTFVANNGTYGVFVASTNSATETTAVFNRVEANNNNFHGIALSGGTGTGSVNATVADSVVSGNAQAGFYATVGPSGTAPRMMVTRSVAANNKTGVKADGGGVTILLGQSTVTGNENGWLLGDTGGVVESYGTNQINGNGSHQSVGGKQCRGNHDQRSGDSHQSERLGDRWARHQISALAFYSTAQAA